MRRAMPSLCPPRSAPFGAAPYRVWGAQNSQVSGRWQAQINSTVTLQARINPSDRINRTVRMCFPKRVMQAQGEGLERRAMPSLCPPRFAPFGAAPYRVWGAQNRQVSGRWRARLNPTVILQAQINPTESMLESIVQYACVPLNGNDRRREKG